MSSGHADRRPIAQRDAGWAKTAAARLARLGVRPNQISVLSVVVAAAAAAALVAGGRGGAGTRAALFVLAGLLIETRLLCNLFDGMLAVEGGMHSKSGVIYNDLPDRLSDALILTGAGYAIGGDWPVALGWAAALLAVTTAYVRTLGGAAGLRQDFGGPMAKQQRMQVIVAACALGAGLAATTWSDRVLVAALVIVVAGSSLTVARRTLRIVRELESR